MKRALISGRNFVNEGDVYQAIDERLLQILNDHGIQTLLSGQASGSVEKVLTECEAVILTGGESFGLNASRDSYEMKLLQLCEKNKVALFGICRGMQVIARNVGFMTPKIETHVRKRHSLKNDPSLEFNCFHQYGVVGEVAGFETEWSADGLSIEKIRHSSLPVSGVMFHPEREPLGSKARTLFLEELDRCISMR